MWACPGLMLPLAGEVAGQKDTMNKTNNEKTDMKAAVKAAQSKRYEEAFKKQAV